MNPDSSAKSDSEDLLAPPEFGSFDGGSSDTMLPIATSMEELLEADDVSGPSAAALAAEQFAKSEGGDETSPKAEDEGSKQPEKAAAVVADEPEVVAASDEDDLDAPPNRTPLIIGAAAVILLGIGVAVMSGGSDDPADPPPKTASADGGGAEQDAQTPRTQDPSSGTPTKAAPSPSPSGGDGGESLPSDLEALKAMSFEERHKLLAVATGDVVVEDHVALDLVQAKDAPEPCRTFSDALSTIESAEDTDPFSWAIEEAVVPDQEDPACAGLSGRLSRLKEEEADPVRKAARRSTKRRSSRSSSRSSAPDPAPKKPEPTPEPEPAAPPEPVKPEPEPEPKAKPAVKRSVADKLDDEGLKELD